MNLGSSALRMALAAAGTAVGLTSGPGLNAAAAPIVPPPRRVRRALAAGWRREARATETARRREARKALRRAQWGRP